MATRDDLLFILATEVQTDPLGRGYNGAGSENPGPGPMSDLAVSDSMNVRNRPTVGGNVPLNELYGQEGNGPLIDGGELTDMRTTSAQDFQFVMLLSALWLDGAIAPDDDRYVEIAQIFPGGSATRLAMNNRLQGVESRAEELDLPRVREGFVTEARAVDLGQAQASVREMMLATAHARTARLTRVQRIQLRLGRDI